MLKRKRSLSLSNERHIKPRLSSSRGRVLPRGPGQTPTSNLTLARMIDSMGGYSVYQIGPKKGQLKEIKSLRDEYRRILQCKRTSDRASGTSRTRGRSPSLNQRQRRVQRALSRLD